MASVDRKEEVRVLEEPLKLEEHVHTPGEASGRRESAASPPPNCSICLGKLVNKSFTDSCLHQFCFGCLLQWSKIKTECPLCKQSFTSIIHNVRSEKDYDQYHVPRELAQNLPLLSTGMDLTLEGRLPSRWESVLDRRVVYRTTPSHYRLIINSDMMSRPHQLPSVPSQVPQSERRLRRANPDNFRRNIYRNGLWAITEPDVFGRFRECSAQYYRRHPNELCRLLPWINRELQVLLNNNNPHVAHVLGVINDALTRLDITSTEFADLVRPYFTTHTEHFVHELANFARTNFDLVGYDQYVTYVPNGLSNEFVERISPVLSSTTDSDDSDICVINEMIDVTPRHINVTLLASSTDGAGPSSARAGNSLPSSSNIPVVLTCDSSSSEGECEVVGYVKPRSERTPEVINLATSDDERYINQSVDIIEQASSSTMSIILDEHEPSTSYKMSAPSMMRFSSDSSSLTITDLSDSDYTPERSAKSKQGRRKTSKKKTSSDKRYSRVTRSRRQNDHSSSDRDTRRSKRTSKRINPTSTNAGNSDSNDDDRVDNKNTSGDKQWDGKRAKATLSKTISTRNDQSKHCLSSDTINDSSSSYCSCDVLNFRRTKMRHKSRRAYSSSSSDSSVDRDSKSKDKMGSSSSKRDKEQVADSRKSQGLRTRSNSESSSHKATGGHLSKKRWKRYRSASDNERSDRSNSTNSNDSVNKSSKAAASGSTDHKTNRHCLTLDIQGSESPDQSYSARKKSKHKDKRRDRSDSDCSPSSTKLNSGSSATATVSSSSRKYEDESSSKQRKSCSSSKRKHKSHKKSKESKRKRSQSDSKSKSKKKRRRSRSYSYESR